MEFQGSLTNLMIGDIVQILEAKQATGQLVMEKEVERQTGSIYLRGGQIVHIVTPTGNKDPYALCELLEWEGIEGGVFRFLSGTVSDVETIAIPNEALIIRCEVARDVFAFITQRYGSMASVLRIVPEPPRISLGEEHWRLLRFIDDMSTIREVLIFTNDDPSEFVDVLNELISNRVVEVEWVEPREPVHCQELSAEETLKLLVEVMNAICKAYSRVLGDVVLANYLRRPCQELSQRYRGLQGIEVVKSGFSEGFIRVAKPAAVAQQFGNSPQPIVDAFRDWVRLFRNHCIGIVHRLAELSIEELTKEYRGKLEALGFYDGL